MADRDYEVGYGKTPKHTRFKPKQSGNPSGRPKGARGLKAELEAELNEYVSVTINGRTKRVRKRRLVIAALTAKAIKGNVAAADKLLALMIQAFGFEDERPDHKLLSDTDRLILEQFLSGENEAEGAGETTPIDTVAKQGEGK